MELASLVDAAVRERFAADVAPRVAEALRSASITFYSKAAPSERIRVHLAIVLLSGGDLTKFKTALAVAETDWRDVLVAAGLANADWRNVLDAHGWHVS